MQKRHGCIRIWHSVWLLHGRPYMLANKSRFAAKIASAKSADAPIPGSLKAATPVAPAPVIRGEASYTLPGDMDNPSKRTEPIGSLSKRTRGLTYYDILGIPIGVGIDHVKDSYRLLTRKNSVTDAAYRVLTDPARRKGYDSKLLRETGVTETPIEQDGDYFVAQDDAGWHVLRDKDVGWELQSFLPDGSVRLKAPKPLFGPFSEDEAEEFARVKGNNSGQIYAGSGKLETNGSWAEWGAPREMPQRPPLPTPAELHYIAGIERVLRSGVAALDALLEYTPEELFGISGISLETQSDADFFIHYVQWLRDVAEWHKSLPDDLAGLIVDGLATSAEGRYKFLIPLLARLH